jgi:hypothetical protein
LVLAYRHGITVIPSQVIYALHLTFKARLIISNLHRPLIPYNIELLILTLRRELVSIVLEVAYTLHLTFKARFIIPNSHRSLLPYDVVLLYLTQIDMVIQKLATFSLHFFPY